MRSAPAAGSVPVRHGVTGGPSEVRRCQLPKTGDTMTVLTPANPAYDAGEAIPRRRWLRVIP
ncbi:MAG TPA: hypothetical protein VGT98_05410, partial [Candidatus Elarobacter sp.]|nr:hypothetical protein [Candidatus Elarobacter sp.]